MLLYLVVVYRMLGAISRKAVALQFCRLSGRLLISGSVSHDTSRVFLLLWYLGRHEMIACLAHQQPIRERGFWVAMLSDYLKGTGM